MNLKEQLKQKKYYLILTIALIFFGASVFIRIGFENNQNSSDNNIDGFPDFITKNSDYFVTRIGNIPQINPNTYELFVWGQLDNPKYFTLNELLTLNLTERTLTTECIGNRPKGPLLSTTVWKGFLLYDLLDSLGLKVNATGV